MHILILHNEYAAVSGEEHALRAIERLLRDDGCEVSWFLKSSAVIKNHGDKAKAFFAGIHIHSSVKELRSLLQRQTFDMAFVQNLYPFLSPSILPLLKEFGLPVIMRCPNYRLFCPNGLCLSNGEICERCFGGKEHWCVIRNCEEYFFKSLGYAARNAAARVTGRILNNVDVFIVLSEFQKQKFMSEGIPEKHIAILPNIAPAVDSLKRYELGDMVSFVGRVSVEKGIGTFLEAAKELPDVSFAIAGAYDQMPELPKNSPPNVKWLGFLEGDALNDLYLKSRVLVFPSCWYEGFPNVITRAMILQKPVIASRLGGVPEIVEDGQTGLLFEPGNTKDLVRQISKLYENPDLCRSLGAAGRIKAEREYGSVAVYSKLMAIFEQAKQMNQAKGV
ncbi:MAG: glycosyltransferase family 4 protein [Smithella sp.]|nr:glycosyltransferase family 4 protein [Smithella sp.]